MIDDILYQHFIRRGLREYLTDIAFILLFSLGAGSLFSVLSPLRATLLLTGSLFLYFWLTYYLFAHYRMWVADFLPMTTLFVTYAGIVSYRFFFEEGEKRKVRSAFSQYMHPGLINQMLNRPEALRLGGEEKELTALFADIRGFTTLSENLTPSQLVDLLNEYLSEMTELIFKNWGTLDKYIGDAIMAFWGAPYPQTDHALRACRTGLEMLQALERLQAGLEIARCASPRYRHRHQYRPHAGRKHGIEKAIQFHRHGRQRQPGIAPGRHQPAVRDQPHHQ